MNQRIPNEYLLPDPDNLPPNSILNSMRVADTAKPMPHLMRLFNGYVRDNVLDPKDLPEVDFQEFGQRWLPLFNYGAFDDQSDIPIMDWVDEVAGSPYKEVRIMRYVDGMRVEVARVPALWDQAKPYFKDDERDYFAQMATMQAHIHGGAGHIEEANGFIQRNLTNRIDVNARVTEAFYRMNAIFELYGQKREIPDWVKRLEGYREDVKAIPTGGQLETKELPKPQTVFNDGMIEEDD